MEKKNLFTKENILKGLKWFFFSFIWLAVLMFIIDIVSKQLIKNFMDVGQTITLIPNFLTVNYVQNNGMAFGIDFKDKLANAIVFISVSVIGAGIILFALIKYWKKFTKLPKAALMLALSGTIGNLVDRAFYVDGQGNHFVVDFIGFQFGPNAFFPRFNVADSCLVIGVIMLIVYFIVKDVKESKLKKENEMLQMQGDVKESNVELEDNSLEAKQESQVAKENQNKDKEKE